MIAAIQDALKLTIILVVVFIIILVPVCFIWAIPIWASQYGNIATGTALIIGCFVTFLYSMVLERLLK